MICVEWARIPGTTEVKESGKFPNFTGLRLGNGARPDPDPDPESQPDETWLAGTPPLEIETFELAVYPVTVAQFRPFVEQGYRDDHWWSEAGRKERGDRTQPSLWDESATLDPHPVVGVPWYAAEAYCNWLNAQLNLQPGTIRLPTEAEWEWAARGPEGRRYPWGDEWEVWRCNSDESGVRRTSAVGGFPGGAADWWRALDPTGLVVHDLAGNVWEWTASEYTEDYRGAQWSVLNANSGGPWVVRGGPWLYVPLSARAASRFGWITHGYPDLGFRLAKDIG